MNKILFPVMLSLIGLTGCARHYSVTLNNNHVVTTYSKPKLNKAGDAYVFKDGAGRMTSLPAGNIKLIEPYARGSSIKEPLFKPSAP